MNIIVKILNFLFKKEQNRKDTRKSSSDTHGPLAQMKKAKLKAEEFKKKNQETQVVTVNQLTERIRNNIFFLENLVYSLDKHTQYLKYKNKVLDLQKQSEDSLKIVLRINKKAPYYQATMKSVIQHTNTISKLVNIPY